MDISSQIVIYIFVASVLAAHEALHFTLVTHSNAGSAEFQTGFEGCYLYLIDRAAQSFCVSESWKGFLKNLSSQPKLFNLLFGLSFTELH